MARFFQLRHEKTISFCHPYWLSKWQNISFQNSRWPDPYPALSLSPELPTVPALTLLRWREVCPLRGQVSPGIILVNSKIMFPSIGHSQATRNHLSVKLIHTKLLLDSGVCFLTTNSIFFSSRTDLVPPLPVTRAVDMTGSSTATSQVSFCSLEQCFIQGKHCHAQVQRLWIWCYCLISNVFYLNLNPDNVTAIQVPKKAYWAVLPGWEGWHFFLPCQSQWH